ncbi:hypothetical protein [Alicyclobacillus dauci]|uniref:DUF5590 domain-containing protein n=1 Tax=Alicyclobacillus dauci TaxID=1475485 RepID=A0ABY6YYF3_9BACL|nr:hypothetical protein [Alicyclobacillus dauci]WAH35151.1 hypothetical protein NZD86_12575 [Alicyclobacillus dauci]
MKTWKIWLITIPVLLVMVGATIVAWLWQNLSTNWIPEERAAQYVLDHTPINRIETYNVFTASGLEDVFKGKDTFDNEWYAFYIPSSNRVFSIRARDLVSQQQVEGNLLKQNIHSQQCTLGYVTDQASGTLQTSSNVVYEVRGTDTVDSKTTFIYVDATNGHVLWKYVL